jgi:hypothetical protein
VKPWVILRNVERYPGESRFPDRIEVFGTLEQARYLAGEMSGWYPGCDYYFYVEGDE